MIIYWLMFFKKLCLIVVFNMVSKSQIKFVISVTDNQEQIIGFSYRVNSYVIFLCQLSCFVIFFLCYTKYSYMYKPQTSWRSLNNTDIKRLPKQKWWPSINAPVGLNVKLGDPSKGKGAKGPINYLGTLGIINTDRMAVPNNLLGVALPPSPID